MAILRLLILSLVLSLTLPMAVFATNDPIPGVDIIVRKNPGGIIMHLTTDKTGALDLSKLPKGRYSFEVADTSRLPKAFVMTFTIPGTAPLVSVPILPTKTRGTAKIGIGSGELILKAGPGSGLTIIVSIFDRWGKQSSPVSPVAVGNSRSQTDHDTGESGGAGGL